MSRSKRIDGKQQRNITPGSKQAFMINYRKATLEDVPELVRLRIAFLNEVMNVTDDGTHVKDSMAAYFTEHLSNGEYVNWLAADGDVIVATGGVFFYRMPPNLLNASGVRAYILNIYTLPSHRKQGIAKQVFSLVMQEVAGRSILQASLHATADARALYEQFGFRSKDNEMVWGKHI